MNKLIVLAAALFGANQLSEVTRTKVVVAPGQVEPVHDAVKLTFGAHGRIAEILVNEGDQVRAGQVLARLDDRLAKARVAASETALAQMKARHLLARHGPRARSIAVARVEADAATAAAQLLDAERANSEQLGQVAGAAVDAEDTAARIVAAQAELDAARIALDQTVLIAPTDGVILRRAAEVGALVTPGGPTPMLSMADLRQLEIRAEIDEADVAGIAPGQAAYVTAAAYGKRRFPVRVIRVTHEVGRKTVRDEDPRAGIDTRVLDVICKFDGARDVALPLGLRMQLHIRK